ncbi:MAG: GNAT family N-acetyltransferase [Lachnospiraceae bacterium]|nr:GNAT family N-acetyltransferase [Lachnospiraceae bacterium]
MNIRRAVNTDIPDVLRLLSQVLEVHAAIRPDIFVSGTTKYSSEELAEMFCDDSRPVYVAADGENHVMGYVFCQLQEPPFTSTMIPRKILFIDDLCVDESARGKHVGKALFEHVKAEAGRLGCYEITLNVWEGNDSAISFYRSMGMSPKETMMEFII